MPKFNSLAVLAIFLPLAAASLLVSPAMATNSTFSNTPSVIQQLLVDEALTQGVDPALALAMAEIESNFDANALSKAGAKGVMQIMPATAENVFGVASHQLYDPKININLGVSFIKRLLSRYNQRLDIALSHYNGGSAVRDHNGGLSVIPATQKYVAKVLSAKQKYQDKVNDTALTANINKPSRHYVSAKADDLLYQKVEKLRNLRLHNIMRNTLSKSSTNNSANQHLQGAQTNKLIIIGATKPKQLNNLIDVRSYKKSIDSTQDKTPTQSIRRSTPRKANIPMSDKRTKVLLWEQIYH